MAELPKFSLVKKIGFEEHDGEVRVRIVSGNTILIHNYTITLVIICYELYLRSSVQLLI